MGRHKPGRKSHTDAGLPAYRLHKSTGQAVVTLPAGHGKRRDVYLGRFGTQDSKDEYQRVLAEWNANGRRASAGPDPDPADDITVNELVSRFIDYADAAYRDAAGEPTTEYANYQLSLHPLRLLFGHLPARKFGPAALEQVRDFMVGTGSGKKGAGKNGSPLCGRGLNRRVVNQRVGRIKRFFAWAVSKEMVPVAVHQALLTVKGLREGRSPAREGRAVAPVPDAVVEATLPYLTRPAAAVIRVQRLTGARPGEVCAMRPCDIDTSGPVWVYRPGSDRGPRGRHKTAYHGRHRAIAIGPRAQEVIQPFLQGRAPDAYLFSPREAMAEFRRAQRASRKSKVQPSQADRSKARPKKAPGDRYNHRSLGKAIKTACARHGIPPWHPHQLRHTVGTLVRKAHGVEAAQTVLGHASLKATEVYAESDLAAAVAIAQQMG